MNLNDYAKWTDSTAVYPEANRNTEKELNYLIVALGGEAGELLNNYKKRLRDESVLLKPYRHPKITPAQAEALLAECGDVLWYLVRVMKVLGHTPESVAQLNHDKLEARKAANALKNHSERDE